MKHKSFVWGLVVTPIALLGLSVALANSVSVPNTFVAGTPALAAEVNQNFEAVAAAINKMDVLAPKAAVIVEGGNGTPLVARYVNNVSATPITVTRLSQGQYEVELGFDVSERYWTAVIGNPGAGYAGKGHIDTAVRLGNDNAVFVRTSDTTGTDVDTMNFHLIVF